MATPLDTKRVKRRSRPILRKFEATLGMPLFELAAKLDLKTSKLAGPKKVFLPNCGIWMNYFEREAKSENDFQSTNTPTIVLFHGIGSSGMEFCSFLRQSNFPDHIRILIPELVGHGEDLKRVRSEGVENFEHPDATLLLETTSEFLDVVKAGPNCNALGTSLGGAVVYFLKRHRPDVIQNSVLIGPALPAVLTEAFLGGLIRGSHRFMDFQSREDVKSLFRTFLWTDPQKRQEAIDNNNLHNADSNQEQQKRRKEKKDPFPKLAYEVIYRLTNKNVPEGHFRALQDKLIAHHGQNVLDKNSNIEDSDDIFSVTTDIDRDSHRLVVWPEEDQIVSLEKGKRFFGPSIETGRTVFHTIPDCGHVFDANGTNIYDLLVPIVRPFLLDFDPDRSKAHSPQTMEKKEAAVSTDTQTLQTVESC